ncbi:DegV family protein [Halalkalibacillus halophilus]|uniref:DegV family protein n=1 Tax=Halalkalibacillus halophilus TaxID=392827 RepID=UPI00041E3125|nr:DegV family protein [Halalkalibacillus halophilus]
MAIQFMVDGGADLPTGFEEKHNIKVIPLNIHFGEEVFKSGVELTVEDYYRRVNAQDELPKTSAPSPNDFYERFKEVDPETPILMLSLTKNLSATFQNAGIGKDMLLEEEPNRTIEIVNTKTASNGITLILNEAIKLEHQGIDFDEIVEQAKSNVERTVTLFSLKTVENLIKGGRLDKVRGTIARTLNIKLLMKASDEGDIEVTEKVRGEKKALRRLVEQIGDYTKSLDGKMITIAQSNCEEKARQVLANIKDKYNQQEEIMVEMGPLIATHAGEGGLVISFLKDK